MMQSIARPYPRLYLGDYGIPATQAERHGRLTLDAGRLGPRFG